MLRVILLLLLLATSSVCADERGVDADTAALDRRYSEVAVLMTHNAMSYAEGGWLFPNQTHSMTRQLRDGVRGLMLDVHSVNGKPYLVHSNSLLGRQKLVDGLAEIRRFLESHPQAIVTIIFESYVDAQAIWEACVEAKLLPYIHRQPKGKPWPKQRAMVETGRRLVLFSDRGGGAWAGFHATWDYCQETHFSVRRVADFDYRRNRGRAENELLIFNHFLTAPVASKALAKEANAKEVLRPRAEKCAAAMGRRPKFVVLDFYEVGDGRATVRWLNQTFQSK